MTSRKLPRIMLEKTRSASPADRRKAVTVLGDGLREHGATRLLVPDDVPFGSGSAREIGLELLALLDEYFGLEDRPLASAASNRPGGSSRAGENATLLELHLVGEASEIDLQRGDERIRVAARSGEWIAVAGPALEILTGGVVERARAGAATSAASPTVERIASPESITGALPAFLDT